MARQPQTSDHRQNRPVIAQSGKPNISRTKVAYWKNRLEKYKSKSGVESPTYSVRILYQGERARFPLSTSNKEAAASKASKIFSFLIENGWEATLEKFKPRAAAKAQEKNRKPHTIGDLIAANQKFSTAREQSRQAYAKAMRRIAAGVMEVEDGRNYKSRGEKSTKAWRDRIDSISLSELSPTSIQSWKSKFLQQAGVSSRRQATTTVNSLIRNAKALFSKKLLPILGNELDLPSPLPFEGVTMEKAPSSRYRSKINAQEILKTAAKNLKPTHPESYKALLLAGVCGLRVSEIDWLLWEALDFTEGILEIKSTKHHQLKSEDSEGEIALSPDMLQIFKDFASSAEGEFIVESNGNTERSTRYRSYRCKTHFDTLRTWLHSQGVTAQKPIHELRKEIGSVIASEEGIFAASRYLRHSDIRITSNIYADQKKRIIPSVGQKLLR